MKAYDYKIFSDFRSVESLFGKPGEPPNNEGRLEHIQGILDEMLTEVILDSVNEEYDWEILSHNIVIDDKGVLLTILARTELA